MGCKKLTYYDSKEALEKNDFFHEYALEKKGVAEKKRLNSYLYGFNGMEKDDELKGSGNSYTTEFRQYDPRLGRWLSVDPLASKYPGTSPYMYVLGNPVNITDPDGRWSKFGAWIRSKFDKHAGDVYKTEGGDSDDYGYNRNTYDKNGKLNGWEGVFEKSKPKKKSIIASNNKLVKKMWSKLMNKIGIIVYGDGNADQSYANDGPSDVSIDFSKLNNWDKPNPFKKKEEPSTPDYFINNNEKPLGPVLRDKEMPQSLKSARLDPEAVLMLHVKTIKGIQGNKEYLYAPVLRKDSAKTMQSIWGN